MAHNSAQPCGCDPGANYLCEDHRLIGDVVTDTLAELGAPRQYGNCQTCDGYVLNETEAPYCPSCARQRRRDAKDADRLTLTPTRYMLRLKLKVTGDVSEHSFDSMTARNLFVFTVGPWADVQEEWTA